MSESRRTDDRLTTEGPEADPLRDDDETTEQSTSVADASAPTGDPSIDDALEAYRAEEDVPTEDAEFRPERQPDTQGTDPTDAELGETGEGDDIDADRAGGHPSQAEGEDDTEG